MATTLDHKQSHLSAALTDGVHASEQHASESPNSQGSLGIERPLEDIDLIVEELDSLLHTDKHPVSISDVPKHVPWFAWALLAASLVAVSSAAVVFASIPDVPTFALAAWRLQLTTVLLSPAAMYQYTKLTPGAWCAYCNCSLCTCLQLLCCLSCKPCGTTAHMCPQSCFLQRKRQSLFAAYR